MKKGVLILTAALLINSFSFGQVIDSSSKKINEYPFHFRSLTLPVVLIGYGFATLHQPLLVGLNESTRDELKEDHPMFRSHADDFLQYTPAMTVYGLNAIGIKGKNNFRDRTMIFLMSQFIMGTSVILLKHITHEERPDGSDYLSFPSGHTATAFSGAEFLRMEYKDVSPWIGYTGYGIATATGILRLYNNKHWLGDIVAGAGFGILATRAAYWLYPAIKKKLFRRKNVTIY